MPAKTLETRLKLPNHPNPWDLPFIQSKSVGGDV